MERKCIKRLPRVWKEKVLKDYLGYGKKTYYKITSGMERKCIKILPRVWKENVLKDYLGYGKKMY